MKTLLVNCSLKTQSEQLQEAIRKFSECALIQYRDVQAGFQIPDGFDSVVISGSGARIVNLANRAIFGGVENLIKSCRLPILGICFGHQLLCSSFGAKTAQLSAGNFEGFENIHVLEVGMLFEGFQKQASIPLAENHYDYVQKDSLADAGFTLLADSASCETEAVKHKTKPFYGVQFHPELTSIKGQVHPEGRMLIGNFYRNVVKR